MLRLVTLLSLFLLLSGSPLLAREITVFAAASLTDVMEDLAARYELTTNEKVRFSFAGSSVLARQIEAGAPAHLFVSANIKWVNYLEEKNLTASGTRATIASNKLVLVIRNTAKLPLSDIEAYLGSHGRLAVADPAHVPSGQYAREALIDLGQWPSLEPRLALADNVRSALALVHRGEAPAGIVYATDIRLAPSLTLAATFPVNSHSPIKYEAILTKTAATDSSAHGFLSFLKGLEAADVFVDHGFGSP